MKNKGYEDQINSEDHTRFIENFNSRRRSFIAGMFRYAIRGETFGEKPTKDVTEILRRVAIGCERRINDKYHSPLMRKDCQLLLDILSEARGYARCSLYQQVEEE